MKEIGNKLKLTGKNIEDLKIISAYCQDAVVKVRDLVYLKKNRIFLCKIHRFMWEDLEKGIFRKYKRIQSILRFDCIDDVISKNINQSKKDRNLELLTIKPVVNNKNNYEISLIFSGNSIMLLNSEIIEVTLDDQNIYWGVKNFPKHKY